MFLGWTVDFGIGWHAEFAQEGGFLEKLHGVEAGVVGAEDGEGLEGVDCVGWQVREEEEDHS